MPAIKAALASADSAVIARQVQQNRNVELEIDGRCIEFEPEDIQVQTTSAEGYVSSSADGCLVALDTSLDHALIIEGLARELVRTVQDARKSAGLEISDRIALEITGTARVLEALQQHRKYIMTETLALELSSPQEKPAAEVASKIDHRFQVNRTLRDDSWQIVLAKQ